MDWNLELKGWVLWRQLAAVAECEEFQSFFIILCTNLSTKKRKVLSSPQFYPMQLVLKESYRKHPPLSILFVAVEHLWCGFSSGIFVCLIPVWLRQLWCFKQSPQLCLCPWTPYLSLNQREALADKSQKEESMEKIAEGEYHNNWYNLWHSTIIIIY